MLMRAVAAVLVWLSAYGCCTVVSSAAVISIDIQGATALHTYHGHGALSAGASSRLLWDYPEPQRSEVCIPPYNCTA